VRSEDPDLQLWIAQTLLSRQAELASMGAGSTGQTELSRARLEALPISMPSGENLVEFNDALRPLSQEAHELRAENQVCASTRDLMLPRLVRGKLDVADLDLGDLTPTEHR
jgi:type I restriction enzyme S subunit